MLFGQKDGSRSKWPRKEKDDKRTVLVAPSLHEYVSPPAANFFPTKSDKNLGGRGVADCYCYRPGFVGFVFPARILRAKREAGKQANAEGLYLVGVDLVPVRIEMCVHQLRCPRSRRVRLEGGALMGAEVADERCDFQNHCTPGFGVPLSSSPILIAQAFEVRFCQLLSM